MEKLERIPEVTEHVLAGLTADESLKHRIFLTASAPATKKKYPVRTVVALCSLSVLLILLCVFALTTQNTGDIQVIPAGRSHSTPPVKLESVLEKAAEAAAP